MLSLSLNSYVSGSGTPNVLDIVCRLSFGHNLGVVVIITISIVVISSLVVAVPVVVLPSFVVMPVTVFRLVLFLSPEPFLFRLLLIPGLNMLDWCRLSI